MFRNIFNAILLFIMSFAVWKILGGLYMKTKKIRFSLISAAMASLAVLSFSSAASAQSISLYEQPSPSAKVIGSADLSSGIIPIYTPPNNKDWIKIADPRNGNVGWIKSSELKSAKGGESNVTFTQKIISTDKQPNSYQVMQFGPNGIQTNMMNNEQIKAFTQKMRIEQQSLQNSFQNIMKNMNDVIQQQWNTWNANGNFPIIFDPTSNMKTQNDTQKINSVTAPIQQQNHSMNEAIKPSSTMGSEMEKSAIEKRPAPKETTPNTNTNAKP
jgi:hypothetical protein